MRKRLEFQADRIEAVLRLNKVPARVTGGTVTPRWVRFQVLPAVGAKISKIKGLSEEMAAALDASSCRVSRRGAAVAIEVPRDDPKPVRLLPLFRQLCDADDSIPPVTAILGLAEDGAPLLIRLSSPDVAHILVAGTTGSGKTMLLQTMILSLAMANRSSPVSPTRGRPLSPPHGGEDCGRGISMVLIDPKGHAFRLFGELPHLARSVIWEPEETTEVLQSLVRLMEKRSGSRQAGGNGNGDTSGRPYPSASLGPTIVVFIDELADLLMVGGKDAQWSLTRLTQRGREAGIHIVAATQKPTTAVLGSLVKANFPVRLVGRVTSVEDARTATGWSGTGAERLMGRGDFLAVAEGRVIRFQAAHVSPAEIQEVVEGMDGGDWREVDESGVVLRAIPAVVSSRSVSLPQPSDWLTEVF
jgi:S-DNA-T family DNA segregation ATPase FtsK/SpoIIIE